MTEVSTQSKILQEQEAHKHTEDELISMKIELNNMKQNSLEKAQDEKSSSKDPEESVLKSKDEEIERLKKEILQEQQVVAHVQVTQEREIIEKEKEIFCLNRY